MGLPLVNDVDNNPPAPFDPYDPYTSIAHNPTEHNGIIHVDKRTQVWAYGGPTSNA